MAAPPIGPPPAGINPNESRASTIIGVVSFVMAIAAMALALRIYTRRYVLKKFGLDDWCACIAFAIVFGCGFAVTYNTRFGFGRHIYLIDPDTIKLYLRTFYVSIVLYNAALFAIKMTFLTQYYRVLAVNHRIKKAYIAALIFVGCWAISQVLVEIFICSPIEAYWDSSVEGRCIPNYPQWYINAAGNILTDLIIFVLPLPVIHKLSLGRTQKVILMLIFCLGFFTCMISFIRIRFLHLTEDHTWDNIESAGWSVGELCSGLTCACLPTFRPLLAKWFPGLSSRIKSVAKCQREGDGKSSTWRTGTTGGWSTHDPEKAGGSRPAWSRQVTGLSRPAWSRHTTGLQREPPGESRDNLHDNAATYGHKQSISTDSGRPLVLQGLMGELSSEESVGMPIMRPEPLDARIETSIVAGRGRPTSLGDGPLRVKTEIVRTESDRRSLSSTRGDGMSQGRRSLSRPREVHIQRTTTGPREVYIRRSNSGPRP